LAVPSAQSALVRRAGEFSGSRVRPGVGAGPALLFEDHREIALFSDRNATALEYRPLLLAADGDVVALSGPLA
jgi:hypothetical protein